MRKITVAIISLVLILSVSFASAGGILHQRQLGSNLPLLPANYICNADAVDTIDLLCGLVGYWHLQEASYNGSSGEVIDSSGQSGTVSQNLILNSNDFTAAGWSSSGTPIVTSTTLEDNDAGALEGILFTVNPIEDEDFYTMSVKVPIKGSAPSHYAGIMIWLYIGGTQTQAGITIDPYNKTITSKSTGGSTVAPYATSIEEVGTDLLISVTLQNNGTGNTFARADYYPAVNTDGSGTWLVTAQGVNTFTDMQLENSSALGPFVATTGSAITNSYNHGKAFNGATTTAAGKLGRSLTLNGATQYVNLGGTVGDFTDNFTIAIWFKTSISASNRQIITRRSDVGNQWALSLIATTGVLAFFADQNFFSDTGGLSDGTWHLVVVVIDGADSMIYIDGLPDRAAFNPVIISRSVDTSIGTWLNSGVPVAEWNGQLDELVIWNRPLSAQKILDIHNSKLGLAIV